jgi:hypothetical protein
MFLAMLLVTVLIVIVALFVPDESFKRSPKSSDGIAKRARRTG